MFLELLHLRIFEIGKSRSSAPVQADSPEPESEDGAEDPVEEALERLDADAMLDVVNELSQAGRDLRVERMKLRLVRVRRDVKKARADVDASDAE